MEVSDVGAREGGGQGQDLPASFALAWFYGWGKGQLNVGQDAMGDNTDG